MNTKMIFAYSELSKPRILTMVLVTTALGFFLGNPGSWEPWLLFWTLTGAGMVCAGAGALNHYLERDVDEKMQRTRKRPLPQGTVAPANALSYGILMVLGGVVLLWGKVNLLTAFLSLATAFLYVVVYTPLKKVTWLNTTIGAIPGAIPPLGGWAAATGDLTWPSWSLFLILFIWQHPHFYAIAWMFRDDYKRGGFKMLPVIEPDGRRTFSQILLFSCLLVPAAVLPSLIGLSGYVYLIGAFVLSSLFLLSGVAMSLSGTVSDARKLLKASVVYLPALLVLFVIDIAIF